MNPLDRVQAGKHDVMLSRMSKAKAIARQEVDHSRVLQCFLNSDLRNGHEGLSGIAKQSGIDVHKLLPGQYVIFINAHKDKLKLYAANNVVAYLKLPGGQRIDLRIIQEIPKAFKASGRIDYDAALKDTIEKALARRRAKIE